MRIMLMTAMLISLGLAGCTNVPAKPQVPLNARVEILDPKVDLTHLPRPALRGMTVGVYDNVRPGSTSTVKMGIHAAVECDAVRTECKHAMVLSALNYQLVRAGEDSAKITGTFDVTVARRIVDTYETLGMRTSTERAIHDSVQVIEEGKFSYPLSAILKIGEPYTVHGRLGTKVAITLQRATEF